MMELCDTNRQEVMGMSRILIVEDEQAIANLVRTVLTVSTPGGKKSKTPARK